MMRFNAGATPGRGVRAGAILAATLLGGCATLPSNGPTAHQILRAQEHAPASLPFRVVDITPDLIQTGAAMAPGEASRLAALATAARVDQIGPGDVLGVQIYEVGTGLFGSGATELTAAAAGGTDAVATPTASGAQLGSGVVVDNEGAVTLPYVGRVVVGGLTTTEAQARVQAALRGKSQSPQALVTIRQNLSNTIVVMGAVQRPGRQPLTLGRERLLDAIAEAGGITTVVSTGNSTATGTGPQDMVVRFTRHGQTIEQPLEAIVSGAPDDLVLIPGDHVDIVRQPRTFIVFGATDRISQVPFESRVLSLAEAIARVGGPADARADPTAVFLFRYAPADDVPGATPAAPVPGTPAATAPAAAPMVYRLDLMNAQSYFLAQRFQMRDKDVIYMANARANQAGKLAQILGLLFSPILAASAVAR